MLHFSVNSEVRLVTIKYKNITSLSIFYSASTTQSFLKKCYLFHEVDQAEQKSYENCYRFIYLLKHGQLYYEQAAIAPLPLKPTLLFYGLVHLIKACILTVQPNYPETTTMLAHGVSTRKKKKQQYDFFEDEVKCQKNGLFPIMMESLFHFKQLEGTKFTMGLLFKHIPELSHLFYFFYKKNTFMKIDSLENGYFAIDKAILDYYHMTENRFTTFLQSKCTVPISFENSSDDEQLVLHINNKIKTNVLPFKYHVQEKQLYFPLHNHFLANCPEIMVHYLLLYNLSMIARYETEWWSELIHTMPNDDLPFIQTFLEITTEKGPLLLFDYLIDQLMIKESER